MVLKLKKECDAIFTDDYLETILDAEAHDAKDYLDSEEDAERVNDAIILVNQYLDLLLDNNKILYFLPDDSENNDERTVEIELDEGVLN